MLLSPDKDPMGRAILDRATTGQAGRLRVFSSQFEEDELPVGQLFRTYDEMPALEQRALQEAKGRILDVGAGSGCHALALQAMGKEVCAIDISTLAVEAMRLRGVADARAMDFFDEMPMRPFDTLLMLMNGSGIVGRLDRMPAFFRQARRLLAPGGSLLMDSSDLRYLYENEDGSLDIDLAADYYGEVDFRMQYKKVKGDPFDWLYVDFGTLAHHAAEAGFRAELLQTGEHYDYLARLF